MQNGVPLFLTSVLTMRTSPSRTLGSGNSSTGGGSQHVASLSEKQVEHQKRHNRRKRNRAHQRKRAIMISEEFRNVKLQEIPPFNAKAVEALGDAAITHNITHPCNLENFERDPSILCGHTALCRRSSVMRVGGRNIIETFNVNI